MFKLIRRNGGFATKLQVLESPDSNKWARRKTRTKIGSEIVIAERRGINPTKRKRRTVKRTGVVNRGIMVITFVETNGPKEERKPI